MTPITHDEFAALEEHRAKYPEIPFDRLAALQEHYGERTVWNAGPLYDNEGLANKMLEFIELQDGEYSDEWHGTQRDFAATILSDFAKHRGVELVVPDYVPQLRKPEVDRNELLKALMPGLRDLFDMEYKKLKEKDE